MPRPLKASVRIRNDVVTMRARGREWTLGPRSQWSDAQIEAERERVVAQIKAGVWAGPPRKPTAGSIPRFGDLVDRYLRNIETTRAKNTYLDASHRCSHLLGYFKNPDITSITPEAIEGFTRRKVEEREAIQAAHERRKKGEELSETETDLLRFRGLSNGMINRCLDTLGAILAIAIEDNSVLFPNNPARLKRLRLRKDPKPGRNRLTIDQVAALLTAADEIEKSARKDYSNLGRVAMIATLALAGLRISELLNLRRSDIDLTPERPTIYVGEHGGKTAAGTREVLMSSKLAEIMTDWMSSAQFRDPDDFLFPTTAGKQRDPDRFRDRILSVAARRADEILRRAKLQPLPGKVVPHTLRRTFATFSVAMNRDPRRVMQQMGHTDARLTMNIYTQASDHGEGQDPRVTEYYGYVGE